MKKIFLIANMIAFLFGLNAQCDILQVMNASDNEVPVGYTTNIIFSVWNDAGGGSCVYPINSVEVVLSLPPNGLQFHSITNPPGGHGPFFNWSYDNIENIVRGVNHTAIPDVGWPEENVEPDVTVKLTAVAVPTYPSNKDVVINMGPNSEYTGSFPADNPDNNSSTTVIQVQAPLPISLKDFTGQTKDCDHIMLNWTTSSEVNNDYMEILRSSNGKQFVTIGRVKGSNSASGGTYSFNDDDVNLKLGKKYYYKIRQVDLDGKSNVLKTIVVNHYCGTMIPEFEIFPNPASDIINVSFSGVAKDQETELVFLNKLGVVAKKLKVKTDETTEIEVRDLPSGVYKIHTMDLEDNLSERFIRIR